MKVPPGVRDGSRLRVAGEGAAGRRGGPKGDLYLRVVVRPHPLFERRGDDLMTTVKVPLTTAVLGGEMTVPTLDGSLSVKVPAGTALGQTFRLRGQGLPRAGPAGAAGRPARHRGARASEEAQRAAEGAVRGDPRQRPLGPVSAHHAGHPRDGAHSRVPLD